VGSPSLGLRWTALEREAGGVALRGVTAPNGRLRPEGPLLVHGGVRARL
jgi:hypothetical protein